MERVYLNPKRMVVRWLGSRFFAKGEIYRARYRLIVIFKVIKETNSKELARREHFYIEFPQGETNMSKNYTNIETKLIHAGEPEPRIEGAVSIPIFQTAMYETEGGFSYHDIQYIRLNNTPNHKALHTKLASLENAEAALVTASGMAAITTSLLTLLSAGDHLLIQECLQKTVSVLASRTA